MEDEFYNLTVKGNDLKTYIRRFQELTILYPTMVPNSEKLMEVFIGGLPRSIEGNVTASKPQTLEEAITITQMLMDQVTKHNYVQGTNDHKRKFDDRRTFTNNNYQNNRMPETFLCVRNAACTTQDLALSSVRLATRYLQLWAKRPNTDSNKPKLSRAEDSTLSNHDIGKHPLPPLEKLTGAEHVSGPKTIKSILKSKSTFKAETLKGITINEPSSAPARGNKSPLVSKTNSTPG
ncbi:hypothetical protein Tco_1011849, partial [Tanacetum coccineum]